MSFQPHVNLALALLLAVCVLQVTSVCRDRKSDCANYGASGCVGLYEGWARYHCARFCRYCTDSGIPSGKVCSIANKRHANGERFTCGCSDCICNNGVSSCKENPSKCAGFLGPLCPA